MNDSPISRTVVWHGVVILAATAHTLVLPLEWVLGLGESRWLAAFRWFTLAVFVVDVAVSIASRRRPPQKERARVVHGAKQHPVGFLVVDLLAAVPLYALTGRASFGLFGLFKLIKVARILSDWRRRAIRFDTWALVGFGVYWLVLAGHWLSCGWLQLEGTTAEGGLLSAYVRGLYWTVTTVTSVGYGDITPTSDAQRVYAMLTMLVGLTFFGYVVGVIARVLGRRDPATERFLSGVESLSHASRLGSLPKGLRDRVYDYHLYVWQQQLGHDEEGFLAGLPVTLRGEVSYHLKKDLLGRVALFSETGDDFLKDIAQYLRPQVVTPGDFVFEVGDDGRDMFFIAQGSVEVVTEQGKLLRHLSEGDFFGEIALFSDGRRTASVRSTEYSHLYVLDRAAIRLIRRKYPEVHDRIEARAMERTGHDA
ncbi:MAG: cyclic nucleotide-binding domain-containing protein [Longimicrobiales bacterium]